MASYDIMISRQQINRVYHRMDSLQQCETRQANNNKKASTFTDKSIREQLQIIQKSLLSASHSSGQEEMQTILNLMQQVNQQVCQPVNQAYMLQFLTKMAHYLQILKSKPEDQKEDKNQQLKKLTNILISKITATAYNESMSYELAIISVNQWKYYPFNNQILQQLKIICQYLVKQASQTNLEQLLIITHYKVNSCIPLSESTLCCVCGNLSNIIEHLEFKTHPQTLYIKFIIKSLINKIEQVENLSEGMTKLYVICIVYLIKAAGSGQLVYQIQSILKQFKLGIAGLFCYSTPYQNKRNLQGKIGQLYNAKLTRNINQQLFLSLCQLYICSNSSVIWQCIKTMIQIQTTINMLNNSWSLLSLDSNSQMNWGQNFERIDRILKYIQYQNDESITRFHVQKHSSWISHSIKKTPCLFMLGMLLAHPRNKHQNQKQQILKVQFTKGTLYLFTKYTKGKQSNRNFHYQFYIKKEVYRWTSQEMKQQNLIDQHYHSLEIRLGIEFKKDHKVAIYSLSKKLVEIELKQFGEPINLTIGVKQQDKFLDPHCAVKFIQQFDYIQNTTYHQSIKATSQQNHYQQQKLNEVQKMRNFLSFKKMSSQKQKHQVKINILQQLESWKTSNYKQLAFYNIGIRKINKNYKQMVQKIEGRRKLNSYLLVGVQKIKNYQTLENLIKVVKRQYRVVKLSRQDQDAICFIHSFSIFTKRPTSFLNCISQLLFPSQLLQTLNKNCLEVSSSKNQRFVKKIKLALDQILYKQKDQYLRLGQKITTEVKIFLQLCLAQSRQLMESNANNIFIEVTDCIWSSLTESSKQKAGKGTDVSLICSTQSEEIGALQVLTSENSMRNCMEAIHKIIKQTTQICNTQKQIIQNFTYFLKLIQNLICEVHLEQDKYRIQYVVIVLESCFQILLDFVNKLKTNRLYRELQSFQMYKVLSDFYIILPNLLNLLNTSPKNLSPNPTSFIELFLNSSYRSQILMYNSMKIFGLISKYYKICMLIGSLLEPKPLKYLANASKFLVMHSQQNEGNQVLLSCNDRFALNEIYKCSWKTLIDVVHKQNYESFAQIRKTQLSKVFYNLVNNCVYPIFSYANQKFEGLSSSKVNRSNVNMSNLSRQSSGTQARIYNKALLKIIKFFIQYTIDLSEVQNFVNRIQTYEFEQIINALMDQGNKITKVQNKQSNWSSNQFYIYQLINLYARPINLQLKQPPESSKQRSQQKEVQFYFWTNIYNKVKGLSFFISQFPLLSQPNNSQNGHQFSIIKFKVFQQIRVLLELLKRLHAIDKYEVDQTKKQGTVYFSTQLQSMLDNFMYYFDQSILSNYSKQNQMIASPFQRMQSFIEAAMKLCRHINGIYFSWYYKKQGNKGQQQKPIFKINEFEVYFKTQGSQLAKYYGGENILKQNVKTNWAQVGGKVCAKILYDNSPSVFQTQSRIIKSKQSKIKQYINMIKVLSLQSKLNPSNKCDYSPLDCQVLDDYLNTYKVRTMVKNSHAQALSLIVSELSDSGYHSQKTKQVYTHIEYLVTLMGQLQSIYTNKKYIQIKNQKNQAAKAQSQKNKLQYNCVLITVGKIFQGKIQIHSSSIKFVENTVIDKNKYKQLCVCPSQERRIQQIIIQRKIVSIQFSDIKYSTSKLYLQKFYAVEIYQQNLCYYFVFQSKQDRLAFFARSKIQIRSSSAFLKETCQSWEKSFMSNFEFIIHINSISGRSINDISKYYIFPWTVINFQSDMNPNFYNVLANFRDLTKPVGSIDVQQLKVALNSFLNNQTETQKAYKGFYSNLFIVSKYLMRLQPYASHYVQINSRTIEFQRQVFQNIESQYQRIRKSSISNEELVPQIYCAPEFFRRRGKNHLKNTQNKEIDLNLDMPRWVLTKSPQQFIIKMRRALQSQIVSNAIIQWIDYMFGSKCEHESDDNYYISYIKMRQEHQKIRMMLKLFGQPHKNCIGSKTIFYNGENNQPSIRNLRNANQKLIIKLKLVKLKGSDKNQQSKRGRKQQNVVIDHNKPILAIVRNKRLTIINTSECIESGEQVIHQQQQRISHISINKIRSKNKAEEIIILFLLSQNGLSMRRVYEQVKGGFLSVRKTYYKIDHKVDILMNERFNNLVSIGDFVILSQQCSMLVLKVSRASSRNSMMKVTGRDQPQQLFIEKHCYLLLHRSQIISMQKYSNLSVVVSADDEGHLNVFSLEPEYTHRAYFKLSGLQMKQRVHKTIVHEMGMIVILSNYSNIFVYSLSGHFVTKLGLQVIQVQDILLLDHFSSSDILVSTKNDKLLQIDLFPCSKQPTGKPLPNQVTKQWDEISSKVKDIGGSRMALQRTGVYWKLFVVNSQNIYVANNEFKQQITNSTNSSIFGLL